MNIHHDELVSLGVIFIDSQANFLFSYLNSSFGFDESRYLTDYGRHYRVQHSFYFFEPSNIDEFTDICQFCTTRSIEFTIRGAGHSMNGSSLPSINALLISTLRLNHVSSVSESTLNVECGAQIYQLNEWLSSFNCQLPVLHDGDGPAPTIGGFIRAGGFGSQSDVYGGFWDHVSRIYLWSASNGCFDLDTSHPDFYSIFSSNNYSQVILSADLSVFGLIPTSISSSNIQFRQHQHDYILWFTFICAIEDLRMLRKDILLLDQHLATFWRRLDPYFYSLKSSASSVPPCFFSRPHNGHLIAAGVWGEVDIDDFTNRESLISSVNEYHRKMPYACRYSQTELL